VAEGLGHDKLRGPAEADVPQSATNTQLSEKEVSDA